jgi:hypothetical protein
MRHFNFFENGAPFPAVCVGCGDIQDLFDLGRELQSGGRALLCTRCATELATFIGYAEKAPLETTITGLKAEIVSRETELAAVPTKVEELINGIRSSLTDFIFAVSYSDNADQPKAVSDAGEPDKATSGSGKTPKRVNNTSVKPASK